MTKLGTSLFETLLDETEDDAGATLEELRGTVARQAQDIRKLRAIVTGLVELLAVDAGRLEALVNDAWSELAPPPPSSSPSAAPEPYRILGDPTDEDIAAAKALLAEAQDHHFAMRFAEARAVYEAVVQRYGNTKQAAVARQQIENLG